jgi:hypothetical protein
MEKITISPRLSRVSPLSLVFGDGKNNEKSKNDDFKKSNIKSNVKNSVNLIQKSPPTVNDKPKEPLNSPVATKILADFEVVSTHKLSPQRLSSNFNKSPPIVNTYNNSPPTVNSNFNKNLHNQKSPVNTTIINSHNQKSPIVDSNFNKSSPIVNSQRIQNSPVNTTIVDSNFNKSSPIVNSSVDLNTLTEPQLNKILLDYLFVPPDLYEYLPPGAHIICMKKKQEFRSGFVVKHIRIGKELGVLIENKLNGKNQPAYFKITVVFSDMVKIYKKYDRNTYIESKIMMDKFKDYDKQITHLNNKIKLLESKLI